MKRALPLALALAACSEAAPTSAPSSAPVASPAPTVTVPSGPTVEPRIDAPPEGALSRAERERRAIDLLEGRGRSASLPFVDTDPGEQFEPRLRFAMSLPMKIEVGQSTLRGLEEQAVKKALERDMMRFRVCYAGGLVVNPNLQGRVMVRVVVKGGGRPIVAESSGSDMPDAGVVRCVATAFRSIEFPAPSEDIGLAVVPLYFSPG